jgi:RimJ/RimL family protein N-acetyltransferase
MRDVTQEIEIRLARPEDGPALMAAVDLINTETAFLGVPGERLSWAERATQELVRWRERNSSAYVLALERGEIVGYLGAFGGWFARNRGVIWIGHVGVRQAMRGRGIGAKLFAAMEEWARARESWRLELRVDAQNTAALALYRKCGFEIEGTIPYAAPYGTDWHTHHWMGKLLRPALTLQDDVDAPPSATGDLAEITFRAPRPEDAAAQCAWERVLFNGTPLYLMQPAELADVAAMQKRIERTLNNPHAAEVAAFIERPGAPAQMIGHAGIWVEPQFRMAHDGNLGIAVLPDYWGRGIGRRLAALAAEWAREKKLRRLTGTTMAHNRRGLRFAENLGFAPEIRCRQYAMIDGRAADRIRFGKILPG